MASQGRVCLIERVYFCLCNLQETKVINIGYSLKKMQCYIATTRYCDVMDHTPEHIPVVTFFLNLPYFRQTQHRFQSSRSRE